MREKAPSARKRGARWRDGSSHPTWRAAIRARSLLCVASADTIRGLRAEHRPAAMFGASGAQASYQVRDQARSLTALEGDTDRNRFVAGSFDLRGNNELHVLEFNEDTNDVWCQNVFERDIWWGAFPYQQPQLGQAQVRFPIRGNGR